MYKIDLLLINFGRLTVAKFLEVNLELSKEMVTPETTVMGMQAVEGYCAVGGLNLLCSRICSEVQVKQGILEWKNTHVYFAQP
jgi:hypothetical protein